MINGTIARERLRLKDTRGNNTMEATIYAYLLVHLFK